MIIYNLLLGLMLNLCISLQAGVNGDSVTPPFLILTRLDGLFNMSIDGHETVQLKEGNEFSHYPPPAALDIAEGLIYHVDQSNVPFRPHQITRINLNTARNPNKTFDGIIQLSNKRRHIRGLAVDWIGRKLYWIEEIENTRGGFVNVGVAELNGANQWLMIKRIKRHLPGDYELGEDSIVVHPGIGYFYITERNSINKIAMDGSRVDKILTGATRVPRALIIDHTTDNLIWTSWGPSDRDGHDYQVIEMAGMDGSNHRMLLPSKPYGFLNSIDVYDGYIYYADWGSTRKGISGGIYKIEMSPDGLSTKISQFSQQFDTVKIWHPSRQPANISRNPCGENNGGCSHLCLLSPSPNSESQLGYTCACPDTFVLLPTDNHTCRANCTNHQFHCVDKCLPRWEVCNGVVDCAGGEDEANCPPVKPECKNRLYSRCYSNDEYFLLPAMALCDGVEDCEDNSDESFRYCNSTCDAWKFKCRRGFCLDKKIVCDGCNDCDDNSDEIGCVDVDKLMISSTSSAFGINTVLKFLFILFNILIL